MTKQKAFEGIHFTNFGSMGHKFMPLNHELQPGDHISVIFQSLTGGAGSDGDLRAMRENCFTARVRAKPYCN